MAHQDKGHYAAKHKDKLFTDATGKMIQTLVHDNCLTCASAHLAGKKLSTSPSEIGRHADLLEYRITDCQLGLFGYSDGEKRIDPDIEIPPHLSEELDKKNKDGRISCLECWEIAKRLKIKRLDIGSVCEKKNIRIKPCQLGAF